MALIELRDAGINFKVRSNGRSSLKDLFLHHWLKRKPTGVQGVQALQGLNLTIRDGERVGLIGHNGAGKSTLLKMLAGIYPPTEGHLEIQGDVSSVLELMIGIEPEADGWDNMRYRGYLQGLTPREVDRKQKEVAEFSELGEFLTMPVRHYSSGMLVRLLFSLATCIEPDILLVDEILSTGDLGFVEKAKRRMYELIEKSRILVLATHDLGSIQKFCTSAIWLANGQVHRHGDPEEVIGAYQEHMLGGQAIAA